MKNFDFLIKENETKINVVEQGWSWWFFIFVGLWLIFARLYKKYFTWFVTTAIIAFIIGFITIMTTDNPDLGEFSIRIIFFCATCFGADNCNRWRKEKLLGEGWFVKATIEANNASEAKAKFFKAYPEYLK